MLVAAGAQVGDQGIYLRLGKAISKCRHYLASESNLSQHLGFLLPSAHAGEIWPSMTSNVVN